MLTTGVDDMPQEILNLPSPPADLRVAYGEERSQFIDFRFPTTHAAAAIIIMIHGGFWRQEHDLAHAGHLCAALTACGLATANIEYRRVGEPDGGWPGTFDDVETAIHAVQKRNGNDKPAVVVGHSAGGHLALWAVTRQLDLAAVVALAPVACLQTAWQQRLGDGAVANLLGGAPDAVPDRYLFASPSEHNTRTRRVLIHGTADDVVPLSISQDYVRERAAESDAIRLIELPGADHFDVIDPRSAPGRTVIAEIRRMADASSYYL